jgi:hypothetical protein
MNVKGNMNHVAALPLVVAMGAVLTGCGGGGATGGGEPGQAVSSTMMIEVGIAGVDEPRTDKAGGSRFAGAYVKAKNSPIERIVFSSMPINNTGAPSLDFVNGDCAQMKSVSTGQPWGNLAECNVTIVAPKSLAQDTTYKITATATTKAGESIQASETYRVLAGAAEPLSVSFPTDNQVYVMGPDEVINGVIPIEVRGGVTNDPLGKTFESIKKEVNCQRVGYASKDVMTYVYYGKSYNADAGRTELKFVASTSGMGAYKPSGVYWEEYECTAQDALGNVASDRMRVTVMTQDVALQVTTSPAQVVAPRAVVNLTGDVSLLNGGSYSQAYVLWQQVPNGAPTVTLNNPNQKAVSFVAPDVANSTDFLFSFTVSDSPITPSASGYPVGLAQGTSIVRVLGSADREQLVVSASNAQATQVGTPVTLKATVTAPADPTFDPKQAYFKWTQVGGPNVVMSNENTDSMSFVPNQAGDYVFEVAVSRSPITSSTTFRTTEKARVLVSVTNKQ